MSILASQQAQAWGSIIMWVVIMVVFVYFFMIRPQKKEAKKKEQMMSELAVGYRTDNQRFLRNRN